MRRLFFAAVVVLVALSLAKSSHGENWPQYRGPTGQGQTAETGLPTTWGGKDHENILWKSPLPHTETKAKPDLNQSSPIVWGPHVFVMTCSWPEKATQKEPPEQHVTCYQLADGKQLWDQVVPPGPWLLTDLRGGYGAPTPATDGERVYAAFGTAMLAALNAKDGKILWHQDFPNYKDIDVAFASSPILYEDTVLMLCDKNNKNSSLTAYDRKTGLVKWEQKRPKQVYGHTTPVLVKIGGKPTLLIAASNELQGIDPSNGETIWTCNVKCDVASPVYDGKLVYIDSGRGGPGIAVEPTGTGDITSAIKWKVANIPEALGSPVISGEWLYRLHNPTVVRCFNLESGKEAFSKRLDGVSNQASPFATPEGLVYFASSGKSYVLKAGPTLDIVATNELDDPSSASAAVSGGKIVLKGAKYLWCIGKK
ncbi:MAG TPA: PQQ-binding-like beta-propeller repeat protein [Pirellulales bacterium]|nr:PQQ-binding-like beta-propeller repeat protein [Pirellulales bacterium]